MKTQHHKEKLSDFVDQQLSAEMRRTVGEHIMQCDECRREHDAVRLGAGLAACLEQTDAPDNLWRSIESELDGTAPHVTIIPERRPLSFRMAAGFAMALIVVGLFSGLVYRSLFMGGPVMVATKTEQTTVPLQPVEETIIQPPVPEAVNPSTAVILPTSTTVPASAAQPNVDVPSAATTETYWQVDTLAGNPQIGSGTEPGKLAVGSYLVTDGSSRARVEVANIGSVEVAPNSRVKFVGTNKTQHRLSLERGQLHARIAAPPRLFIVDTPSAVAVDLGCEYTLDVDTAGNSKLHVTSGFVALERDGRESIVPAGAMCLTRKGKGLGTPFSAETSEKFRAALEQFDFASGGTRALQTMLDSRNSYDIITLWHLLSRVSLPDRAKVFDALAAYVQPPASVTREGMLKLNKTMLSDWRESVEQAWFQ
jgi:hypothetical protein